jgi:Secretion system C-terminal sorting domain/N-terminal domain of BNR-repeat neuraminidase
MNQPVMYKKIILSFLLIVFKHNNFLIMKNFCFTVVFIFSGIVSVYGKYTITKFPTISICATFPTPYTTGSFSLNETSKSGFGGLTKGQTSTTLILGFSNASFKFNPGVGTVTVSGTEVTIVSYSILASSITVTITTAATNNELNVISFNNVAVRATAAATGYIGRTGGTFKVDNKTKKPPTTQSWGDLTALVPVAYSTSSATQAVTSSVFSGSTDNQIIGVQVVITGTCGTLTATAFNFNTTGSTAPLTDILNAKLYYTGTTNVFSTGTLFGSASSPNGAFTINGSQVLNLLAGTYYFWLTYDITATAVNNNFVDAQHVSTVISSTTYADASGNPAGNRQISNNVFYSIAPGNWSDITTVWSRTSGGPACSCAPTGGNGFVFVNHAVLLDNASYTVNFVTVQSGGNLTNAATRVLTVTDNLATTGNGIFSASTSWVLKDITTAGTGISSSSSALTLTGSLNAGVGTTFQMTGGVLLTVNGNITGNGTLALGTSNVTNSNAAGTIVQGTGNITGSGTITLGVNKTIPVGSNLTVAPVVNIPNGIVITNNGTVNMQNNITGGGVNAQWTNSGNSVLDMGGTTSALLTTGKLDASGVPNTVSYSGSGNQNIKTPLTSYYNLYASSSATGIKSLQAALTIDGNIQISTGAQLNAAAAGNTITLNGNWINNSTNAAPFNPSTSTVSFNSPTNVISGTGITSFNILNITVTGILTSNSLTGKVFVVGNWTNDGDFLHNGSDITFDGTTTITGTAASVVTNFNTVIINSTKTLTLHGTETDFDGDITNNGTLAHNGGLVVFFGNGLGNTQNINGTPATLITLNSVTLDNLSGNILLARPLTINTALTLTNGKITTTATNILTLIAAATSTSGSALSFVSGPMKKLAIAIGASFIFPVGKGARWRRTEVSVIASGPSDFQAEYFDVPYSNTTSVTSPLNNVSKIEYWQIDKTTGASTAKVRLYWENAGASGIDNCFDLTVAHWNSGTTSWEKYAGTTAGSCAGTGAGTVIMNTASATFSPFTFGSESASVNPLPVNLLSFTATSNNQNIILKWTTASESNNLYFEIQRSINGTQYEPIGRVAGAGTTSQITHYNFTDIAPFTAINYYRLKQVDIDGKYKYSAILTMKLNSKLKKGVNIYPNPVSNKINISINSDVATNGDIRIINAFGQIIYYQNEKLVKGVNVITINSLFHLSKGIYTLQVVMDNEIFSTKFISTR